MNSAEDIIKALGLVLHPGEGGFFRETYRSTTDILPNALGPQYSNKRSLSTAIYYLLTPNTCSRMHKLQSDEVFHFYLGDPVTMLHLYPDGTGNTITLGSNLKEGQEVQVVVPKGVWQGSFINPGGSYALLGTTVSPGFDFRDFEVGLRQELVVKYPAFEKEITRLT